MNAYLQVDREHEEAEALAEAALARLGDTAWELAYDMVEAAQNRTCTDAVVYSLQCMVVDALEYKTEEEINHFRKVHGLGVE